MKGSEKLGARIASGRTADVHAWKRERVVKLFHAWMPVQAGEDEKRKTAAARSTGLPVPAVHEIVEVEGRAGLVYERVRGTSMMEKLMADPEAIRPLAQSLAELHREVHEKTAPPELPLQKDTLKRRISECSHLAADERGALLDALSAMPQGDRLCHGDFHPGNVMLTDGGPVLIDWVDATRGDPEADVARTVLLFRGHIETGSPSDEVRTQMVLFHDTYLERYMRDAGPTPVGWKRWLPIVAAARLVEGVSEQQEWLVGVVRQALSLDLSQDPP